MSSLSPDSSAKDKAAVIVAFLTTLALAALYYVCVGIVAIWPDSLLYADRARHLLGEGNLTLSAATSSSYPPLYSLLLAVAFLVPNFLLSHQILVGLQIILLASVFFPIRDLLIRSNGVGKIGATALAVIAALSSAALPYATMLGAEALFIPLFIWFTCFYDKFLSDANKRNAWWSAALLALLLLTKEIAWVVFAGAALTELTRVIQKKTSVYAWKLIALPLVVFAIWQAYSVFVLHQPFALLELNFNNGLGRFNFVKNGIVYLCYVGMPLAGLAFMIACFSKSIWDAPLFRFTAFTLLAALLYSAFGNVIIVEHKLDYITNRLIEPFVILPFIVFLRLPEQTRKEITANSLLILFCMMIFGLPYALKTDFLTGMSYWAQSLNNPNLGIIRNVIYILLVSLPVIVIWWKPKWFLTAYTCVAALLTFSNVMQDQTVWSINQDGNFKYVNIDAFAGSTDVKDAKAIYAENNCNTQQSSDIGYVFRCNDLNKILYFVPRALTRQTAQDLKSLKLNENEFVLFASSDNDNAFGKSVAEIGLGQLMRVEQGDLAAMQQTPLVFIKEFKSLGRYINVMIAGKMERVTLLGPDAEMRINADKAGCIQIQASFAADDNEADANGKAVDFILNDKQVKKTNFKPVLSNRIPEPFVLPLQLREGENILKLHYGMPKDDYKAVPASLFMFARPVFKPCK